jgi:hypothetical protein
MCCVLQVGDEIWVYGGHNDASEDLGELAILHVGSGA